MFLKLKRFSNESSHEISDHAYNSELIILRCIVWLSICYNHTSVLHFCSFVYHLTFVFVVIKSCGLGYSAQLQLRGQPSNIHVSINEEELHLGFFTPFILFYADRLLIGIEVVDVFYLEF